MCSSPPPRPAGRSLRLVPSAGDESGAYMWMSAPRPIVPTGTPFPPGFTACRAGPQRKPGARLAAVGQTSSGQDPFPTFKLTSLEAVRWFLNPDICAVGLGGILVLVATE